MTDAPPIPNPLPVGISRTVQYNNRYQRERNFPEDRHAAFSAHIGIAGKSYAKNFRIDRYGEETAFAMAVAWRKEMEVSGAELTRWKSKIGVPGIRRAARVERP